MRLPEIQAPTGIEFPLSITCSCPPLPLSLAGRDDVASLAARPGGICSIKLRASASERPCAIVRDDCPPDGQITSPNRNRVKPRAQKHLASVLQKYVVVWRASRPRQRGASRSSRTLRAGCGGRRDVQRAWRVDEDIPADGEVVRSRSPDAGIKPACDEHARRRWLESPAHRGDHV